MSEPEKSSAGPALFVPPERWRFARWLIQTGRLSEWYDVPQGHGVAREYDLKPTAPVPAPEPSRE